MKVLVTGSSGFLARWIRICSAGRFDVIPYDLPESILDRESLAWKIDSADVVLHAAAVSDMNESNADPDKNFDVNIRGTHIISETCARLEKSLHFISTCCVYGNAQPADVSTVPEPTDIYAASKMAGEYIVRRVPNVAIYRIPTLYGPFMRPALFIHRAIDAISKDEPVFVNGTGMQSRQYGYVEDVANSICDGIVGNASGIHNLNPDRTISVLEVISVAARLLGKPAVKIIFHGARDGEIMSQRINGDCVKTSFEEGMAKTIAWYEGSKCLNQS